MWEGGRERDCFVTLDTHADPHKLTDPPTLPPSYGAEQGRSELRQAVCDRLYAHAGRNPSEIFISDGSKCDIGRLQMMFGRDVTVALQDPAYPVYVDSSVIMGMTGRV